ncbi:LysR substrate-binding domain-containing protein [Streptomyces sp. NBC_01233]|nr:LysR substrate-binding domain-containing protein [Streptomyces sp. NBC_01233]WSP95337.1 LysR substrate-binding domain-containing protein [Streptomyces sp. NBC_01233]
MALTGPGRTLAARIPVLLSDWDQVLRDTKTAASRAARVLRIGYLASAANETTPGIITAFGRCRPGWRAEMRQASWSDPTAGLADADVDVALLRLPFPCQDALRVEVLFTEPAGSPCPPPTRSPRASGWAIASCQCCRSPTRPTLRCPRYRFR